MTYIGPDYFSYRELGQSWGGNYGESESAFVRSLDEFAKAPLKEADYDYDHPGVSLVRVLGPSVESEFKKITKRVAPKESEKLNPPPRSRVMTRIPAPVQASEHPRPIGTWSTAKALG